MENGGFTQAYAFTVTLKPDCFKQPAEIQYDRTYNQLKEYLSDMSFYYTLVAELTKNKNIHYHGVIKFPLPNLRDVIKMFKDRFRNDKLFGFVDIKVMSDSEGWLDYISKELKETYQSINRRPIIYDGYDLFPTDNFVIYGIL